MSAKSASKLKREVCQEKTEASADIWQAKKAEKGSGKPSLAEKRAARKAAANGGANGDADEVSQAIGAMNIEQDFERTATGVLTSQKMSRDIKIEDFTLSFHGRLLIENATIELNHGQRYGKQRLVQRSSCG